MINDLLNKLKSEKRADISVLLEAVKYYRANNQMLQAERLINEYPCLLENSDELKFELANIYVGTDKIKEAVDIFSTLLKKTNLCSKVSIAVELAKLYKRLKNYKKALESINFALQEEPENVNLYIEKIVLQRHLLDGSGAIETLNKIKVLNKEEKVETFIKNIENVEKTRQKIAPYRVFFTWGMHYLCNYDCAYCYAPKPQDITFANNPNNPARYEDSDVIIDAWKYIFDKYGTSRIRLDGGEPTVYPGFYKIVEGLSKIHKMHLNTNLSFDVNEFCGSTDPDSIRVDASLHCEYTDLEEFIKKLDFLKKSKY
ncbi:MAG: radical SAM protein, partial [Endomicrobiaceae bacterium]